MNEVCCEIRDIAYHGVTVCGLETLWLQVIIWHKMTLLDNSVRYLLLQFLDLMISSLNIRSQTGNLSSQSDHLFHFIDGVQMRILEYQECHELFFFEGMCTCCYNFWRHREIVDIYHFISGSMKLFFIINIICVSSISVSKTSVSRLLSSSSSGTVSALIIIIVIIIVVIIEFLSNSSCSITNLDNMML